MPCSPCSPAQVAHVSNKGSNKQWCLIGDSGESMPTPAGYHSLNRPQGRRTASACRTCASASAEISTADVLRLEAACAAAEAAALRPLFLAPAMPAGVRSPRRYRRWRGSSLWFVSSHPDPVAASVNLFIGY